MRSSKHFLSYKKYRLTYLFRLYHAFFHTNRYKRHHCRNILALTVIIVINNKANKKHIRKFVEGQKQRHQWFSSSDST